MKLAYILFFLFASYAFAKDLTISSGKVEYKVKHLVKTVSGESQEIMGKIVCNDSQCEYLIASQIKSFKSSDSNRDLNMLTILEAEKYPLVTVKGFFPAKQLAGGKFLLKARVNFHGIEKDYDVPVEIISESINGSFIIKLEDHEIRRPSLLMVKIDNEVPIEFNLKLKK